MSCKRSNMMNAQQRKNMTELLELISTGNNEELQHESNMFKLRNSFARDVRGENIISSKPRSKKFQVDTTLTSRNAQLSTSVHPDNQNNDPNLIKGSLDSLFGNNSNQYERSHGEHWNRDPRKFRL